MYPHLTGFWHSLPLRHRLTPSCHCECSEAIWGGVAPLVGVPGGVPLESNRTGWEGGQQPSPALAHQQRIGMFPRACEAESPEGVHPLWQEVWRMCLHKPRLLYFPLPSRKGARGMVQPRSRPSPQSQDSRGPRHLAGAPESAPQPQQPTATHPSPTPPNPLPYPMRPD